MHTSQPFSHILITGASSGIGAALAAHYAAPGVRLTLSGRNETRLAEAARVCRTAGAQVETRVLCVTDRAAMAGWIAQADAQAPLDLVIANAGISGGTGGRTMRDEDPDQVRRLFAVNVDGVFNTVDPALARMIPRGRGHIALMSSLAGWRGWPGAPAYCASKAAVKVYGEGLRGALKSTGIRVHVILPGFVRSRMTEANDFPMPFLIEADRAARIIARGIAADKGRIAFSRPAAFAAWSCALLPDKITEKLLGRMPAKSALKSPS